jgi:hypothetical protein
MNTTGTLSAREQAQKILAITDHWDEKNNGLFLKYDGSLYPL